ncbi:MAG: glycoside hydrolase family 15 protein [Candidatus Zixiibacteriota bacterium]|nr:MAG: glycoside hydrolase family 15 protein [candidate division Zixibacteria bacterium]
MSNPYSPIADYGLIGDGRSAALVSRSGSIDWLCWPRFDSPSLFAALLDPEQGGRWSIAPSGPFRAERRYLDDTNVLETRFHTAGGELVLTDFMPADSEAGKRRRLLPENEILRRVECVSGEEEVEIIFAPRPDYGRRRFTLRDHGPFGLRLDMGSRLLALQGEESLRLLDDGRAAARIRLSPGRKLHFSLTWHEQGPAAYSPLGPAAGESLERTVRWWRGWMAGLSYRGPYGAEVARSALALKLMVYAPSGAVIAAPTTSLPERIGGDLNWDYRYCWLRDASLTVRALEGLGFREDAEAFAAWLLHATRLTLPELKVLYDVYGRDPGPERELDHWRGYHDSRPVRRGNAAYHQLQLDVYGEVIDAVTRVVRRDGKLDGETQTLLRGLGRYVCRHWREPDHGIWEPRDEPKHYTHSRVLCWTALDRLLELHRRGALEKIPVDLYREHAAAIREEVETRGWNSRLQSYTQTLDGEAMDSALLLFPYYGFTEAASPRMQATGRRVRERLHAGPGLLHRYEHSREVQEGAFGISGFWAVDFLARGGGSSEEARAAFERQLAYANDLGLYGEEVDPGTGAALGNFPQAFTHVGLINAALSLERREQESADSTGRRRERVEA